MSHVMGMALALAVGWNGTNGFVFYGKGGEVFRLPRAYILDHVAVVPGGEFGKEGHLRLSFATSMEIIKKGIERIQHAVASLE